MKIYLASPFFCRFDKLVKSFMLTSFNKELHGQITFYDPESSGNFSELRKGKQLTDYEIANRIYDDNIMNLDECDGLVFPKFTSDLGTLYELGYAFYHKHSIFSYDYLNDKLEKINKDEFTSKFMNILRSKFNKPSILKIDTSADAVLFGFLASDSIISQNLIYRLDFKRDNLMLAAKFPTITMDGKIINPKERKWDKIV